MAKLKCGKVTIATFNIGPLELWPGSSSRERERERDVVVVVVVVAGTDRACRPPK
jgi:hypothetical protein